MTIGIHQIILSHSRDYPWPHPLKIIFGGVKSVQKDPIFDQILGPNNHLVYAIETLILYVGHVKFNFAHK